MPQPYTLGAAKSASDDRDYHVASFAPKTPAPVPAAWDYSGFCQPVRNQGAEGTCVGHALASGVMGYEQSVTPAPATALKRVLSVRDAYEGARMVEPVIGEGAQPRAALKYAQQIGLCLEADWPYHPQTRGQAAAGAPDNRARNRLATYSRAGLNTAELKEAMYWHGPALAVLEVTDGFWTPDGAGKVYHQGKSAGLHAIALVGWDDTRQAFRLRNSWGSEWGQGGYCWLPYDHPLTEAWVLTPALVDGNPTPTELPWWKVIFPWLPF